MKANLRMTVQVDYQYDPKRMSREESEEYVSGMVLESIRSLRHTIDQGVRVESASQ